MKQDKRKNKGNTGRPSHLRKDEQDDDFTGEADKYAEPEEEYIPVTTLDVDRSYHHFLIDHKIQEFKIKVKDEPDRWGMRIICSCKDITALTGARG